MAFAAEAEVKPPNFKESIFDKYSLHAKPYKRIINFPTEMKSQMIRSLTSANFIIKENTDY